VKKSKKLILKNKLSEIEKVDLLLNKISKEWKLSDVDIFELNLIIEEWVSNIIFYAFEDDEVHEIAINLNLNLNEDSITIIIIDDGQKFNLNDEPVVTDLNKPITERNPGGLGIHFVKSLCDSVKYSRKNGKNELLLTKIIKLKYTYYGKY